MKWSFDQLEGPVYVDVWEEHDYCTVVDIPVDGIGYIAGARRATLGAMKEEWGVLMFFVNKKRRTRAEAVGAAARCSSSLATDVRGAARSLRS